MTNEEIALNLVQSWASNVQYSLSAEEVAKAYLEFLYAAQNEKIKE